ncbi:MAG: DHA2 family efflux MFS transporter permease subunit [Candidatus Wallbacteria bacterium]|nr:DHA2 family efflux MFS transporter permease subunit [Candidatus Wallbacteria bacterium]
MNPEFLERYYRWVALSIIMLGTFMAVLNSSIVNVALPHMMSAFGVNRDQIQWISTGFMLATAVAMPLVGWLTKNFGHKQIYLSSLALFTIGSASCAFAFSYNAMLFARIMQAIGGGAIQPVGMSIITELFEPHERGRALGIWGIGIMVGPAVGPTLGGYLCDYFNWRAIFSVNLPIGVLTLLLGLLVMKSDRKPREGLTPFDFWGYLFLSIGLIASLLALSNGQEKGWDSDYIRICEILTAIGFTMFAGIEATVSHPLFPLKLLLYRNFTLGMILAVFRAIGLFGGVFLLPIFLQTLVGYTTIQTGLWLMPGAVAMGFFMPVAGRLADRYPANILVTIGALLSGISMLFYGNLDPLSGAFLIIGSQIVRGAGLALMMTPLMTTILNSVPRHQVPTVSSFLNVAQSVGASFGIALLNTYVTNSIHWHAVRIGEKLPVQSEAFFNLYLKAPQFVFRGVQGIALDDSIKSGFMAAKAIMHRASVLGFDNGFVVGGIIVLCCIPLCLMLKTVRHAKLGAVTVGE